MSRNFSNPATKPRRWWPRFFIPLGCAALCLLIVVPWIAHAASGTGGFDGVVDSIESRYHVHATRMVIYSKFVAKIEHKQYVPTYHPLAMQNVCDKII